MKAAFKKYFIPFKENDHKPHFLRKDAIVGLLLFVFFIEALFLSHIFVLVPSSQLFASILPNVLMDLANKSRIATDIASIRMHPLLEKAAQQKAQDMAKKGYFAHVSPEGVTPWDWLDNVGYQFSYAGENLAINFVDSNDLHAAWMNSSTHRANILNRNFTEAGIGTARGVYGTKEAIFIVQLFGQPAWSAPIPGKQDSAVTQKSRDFPQSPTLTQQEDFIKRKIANQRVLSSGKIKDDFFETGNTLLGNSEQTPTYASFGETLFAMPRTVSSLIYLILITVILGSLACKIFVTIHIQYPSLILNGILALLVLVSLLFINKGLAHLSVSIF